MSLQDDIKYLGVAMTTNPTVLISGRAALSYGKEAVLASLNTLLSTTIGTKFMNPDYGCRLNELLFEPNDDVLDNLGSFFIKEAIDAHERRVTFVDAELEVTDEGRQYIIYFKIKPYSEIDSFVYPFYTALKN